MLRKCFEKTEYEATNSIWINYILMIFILDFHKEENQRSKPLLLSLVCSLGNNYANCVWEKIDYPICHNINDNF